MELIKQIKNAENEAAQIVEMARQDAAKIHEEAASQCQSLKKESEIRRRQLIDLAVEQAQIEGAKEAELLNQKGQSAVSELQQSCQGNINSSVHRVVEALKNLS